LKAKTLEDKFKAILKQKMNIKLEELCKGIPKQTITFVEYCRNLSYEQEPDYNFLSSLIKEILEENKLQIIPIEFEWKTLNDEEHINSVKNSPRKKISGGLNDLKNDKLNISDIQLNGSIKKNTTMMSQIKIKKTISYE
jgi:hypothetical protein